MGISPREQETTINIYRGDQECHIWTSDTTIITRLDKLCEKAPEYYKLYDVGKLNGEIVDKDYIVKDKSLISFRSAKRQLTEDQRQEFKERMRKMWDDKNKES